MLQGPLAMLLTACKQFIAQGLSHCTSSKQRQLGSLAAESCLTLKIMSQGQTRMTTDIENQMTSLVQTGAHYGSMQ